MNSRMKILHATKWAGSITLLTGIMIFLYGIVSGLMPITGIGIGTIVGAVMFFLMGMFFIATEEMVEKTDKGLEIPPMPMKPRLYLVKR
ncbi:hypothetical protein [Neobacillus rhizophilus]|uniref:Uncharacterized protein n=2 Tax=Neobacillus TaxID=2675232 RepID=A0A942YTD6_9BACI|nr:hypothetical protein [Neobacillus rhizophilus]MBS4211767.1 hypothetical protein [Neobacillus rhizophilus]MBU8919517.1 hypothetical protein [Bacillus sp. FJAT-29953]